MTRRLLLLPLAAMTLLPGAGLAGERTTSLAPVPHFVEEAASAGIDHRYDGPWEYFVGGGVAVSDCNGDRRPDLFLAGGKGPAALYVNDSPTGGALVFRKADTGLGEKELARVTGAYPLDYDNDGLMDLAVLRVGENLLLRGLGACRFEVANRQVGLDGGNAWTTAFAATWEPGAAYPTLAFGNYVDRSQPGAPWGTCHDNMLHRPAPGLKPDYSQPERLSPGYCSLSMLFTDWNRSGEPALRISNDRQYYRGGEEQLWAVPPGRPAQAYRRADGWRKLTIWGMGIASIDLNVDGLPEYALTSMGDTKLQVLEQEGDDLVPVYADIAFDKGVTAHRPYTGEDLRPSTGWHSEFQDVNNDTLWDLYIAKGNVESMPDFAAFDPDNLLLGQWDGKFVETGDAAGIALARRGRGAGLADLNADGLLDLVVVNRGEPASLFRNVGKGDAATPRPLGNWLAIELVQPGKPNRNAVGAKVSVRVGTRSIERDVLVGGGHASGQLGFLHIGLGVSERAQVRVRWPDGEWSHSYRVFANNHVVIERGAEAAKLWFPE
ncbi:hypothetical protein GWI72_15225 [Microvirga tunisiensis]|uniref:ASPIC/UnbV domain-containing protein n=1 Tax=Pannonibacter tanglangensis TaxID=2750084 RepID=A0A7X5F4I9_9HYPH|nr:hypothetical protein [Pannonibacter sp. XCT-53]